MFLKSLNNFSFITGTKKLLNQSKLILSTLSTDALNTPFFNSFSFRSLHFQSLGLKLNSIKKSVLSLSNNNFWLSTMSSISPLKITFLGHAGVQIEVSTPKKNVSIMIDPWLDNCNWPTQINIQQNPPDYVLITHGHGDHCSSLLQICKDKGIALCIHEVSCWAIKSGLDPNRVIGMNKSGGVILPEGFEVIMVNADHSSDISESIPGGQSAGFIIKFPSGKTIYHAGDTGVFLDMKLICDLYQPSLAFLPIGGRYTMGPYEAGYAINHLLPSVTTVIPVHYATFPVLTGTPDELKQKIERQNVKIEALKPGESISY